LLPGEIGYFELLPFTSAPLAVATPPSDEFIPPLTVAMHPHGEQIGYGLTRSDGLHAEVVSSLDFGRVQNVRITNNSDRNYALGALCGHEVAKGALLPAVAWASLGHYDDLAPGASTTVSLVFTTGVEDLRLHVGGSSLTSDPGCCPVTGPSTWHSVDTGPFSALLPPGWTYELAQGIDSFVGSFVGEGITLHFDYGWYSNSLPHDDDPNYHVHFETVAGRDAKIVYPNSGAGETGIYFPHVTDEGPTPSLQTVRHNLIGQNLTPAQRDIALQIFRSIRFDAP
jgi:hypothetical protein